MSPPRTRVPLLLAVLVLFAALFLRFPAKESAVSPAAVVEPTQETNRPSLPRTPPAVASSPRAIRATETNVETLLETIAAGRPLRFSSGDSKSNPIYFRPNTTTAENFQASIGSNGDALEIDSLQVFSGRSILGTERGTLAIVNGQLAAHIRYPDNSIRHFRSDPDNHQLESILEQSIESTCAVDPATNIASTEAFDPLPDDPWDAATPASIEPEIAASSGFNPANGSLQFTDRPIPYGRAYDSSLKDLLVLVVLDKSATGNDSAG